MSAPRKQVRWGASLLVAAGLVHLANPLRAQEPAPAYENPQIQPTLIDFITGLPVTNSMAEAATPPLLRKGFAGESTDTAKGLAAAIKAQQVDAKKRERAVTFLGGVDCVEYPKAQEELIKSLEDSSERVRLAAARALEEQLSQGPGAVPEGKKRKLKRALKKAEDSRRRDSCAGCCNEKVIQALSDRAYEKDDTGCYLEPSERVREACIAAIEKCVHCCYEGVTYSSESTGGASEEDEVPPDAPAVDDVGEDGPPTSAHTKPSRLKSLFAGPFTKKDSAPKKAKPALAAPAKPVVQPTPAPKAAPLKAPKTVEAPKKKKRRTLAQIFRLDRKSRKTNDARQSAKPAKAAKPAPATKPSTIAESKKPAPAIQQASAETAAVHRGLHGHCVVSVLDNKLSPASNKFASTFEGRRYEFSSSAAKKQFDAEPSKYAPVADGADLVVKKKSGKTVEGVYLAKHGGRLYFFKTKENRKTFLANPASFLGAK